MGDILYQWIIGLDIGKEASAIYDSAYAANVESIFGELQGFQDSL